MMPSASTATRSETRSYLFDVITDLATMARRSGDWPVAIQLEAILVAEQLRDAERRLPDTEGGMCDAALTRGREA